jgi:hypothetical protein
MDGTCDDHHSLCLWKYENPAPCSGAVIRTHRTQEQNGCTSKRTEQGRKKVSSVPPPMLALTFHHRRERLSDTLQSSFLQPLFYRSSHFTIKVQTELIHLTIPKAATSDDYPFRARERQSSVGQLHPIAIDFWLIAQPLPRHGFD